MGLKVLFNCDSIKNSGDKILWENASRGPSFVFKPAASALCFGGSFKNETLTYVCVLRSTVL